MNNQYTIEFQQVYKSAEIITGERCNAISFTNKGTDTVYINQLPLEAGESLSINGNIGEHDKTLYKVAWLAAATSKKCYIQIKRYTK